MVSKVIGYYGVDNSEIVLYMARVLKNLKLKVLMVDLSESQCLSVSVPGSSEAKEEIVEYREIHFAETMPTDDMILEYDCVLIHYGFTTINPAIPHDLMVYTTNQLKHHIERYSGVKSTPNSHQQLIIKDYVVCKINKNYILDTLNLKVNKDNVYTFDLDTFDMKYRILSQFSSRITFKKITKVIRGYLLDTITFLYPEKKTRKMKHAIRRARRGK